MTGLGPELDAARARVVAQGLTADAVAQLNAVVTGLSLEALGPVKQQLKRFFSDQPWTDADDDALADAVGGDGDGGRHELEPGLTLVWGWDDGRFRLRVESDDPAPPGPPVSGASDDAAPTTDLDATFDGVVVPEATPSPRTIRFATPPLHDGPSRAYRSAAEAERDPHVARIFATFDDVTDVLVGPDFVAVTIARPDRWEDLLAPMLRAVAEELVTQGAEPSPDESRPPPVTLSLQAGPAEADARSPRRLERAWTELGALRAERPEDLDRILAASRDGEAARRQVAAALLADAPSEIALLAWQRLVDDPSRVVRRSTVDAIAGAGREELRPLLEHALAADDAWTRWKALRGIAALGAGPSRAAVEAAADDPDFRVRLEAAHTLKMRI